MILDISLIKVQHKTMLKFKMSHSNLSKSQEIELRDSISDKTSGHRGSVATPICFLESNTCLVCWAGEGLLSSQHSSLIFLSLLDTWVNELWGKNCLYFILSLSSGFSKCGSLLGLRLEMLQVSSYSCLSIWPSVPQAQQGRRKLLSSITIIAMFSQAH